MLEICATPCCVMPMLCHIACIAPDLTQFSSNTTRSRLVLFCIKKIYIKSIKIVQGLGFLNKPHKYGSMTHIQLGGTRLHIISYLYNQTFMLTTRDQIASYSFFLLFFPFPEYPAIFHEFLLQILSHSSIQ